MTIVSAVLVIAATSCSSARASSPSRPVATTAALLQAPETSSVQDGQFFQDLATSDPSLSSYVNSEQGVALRALLTDGAAFCAFLQRYRNVDEAMESVAVGAKSVEPQTGLPESVKTFNAIDAVALITLCPNEQRLLPASDQARIRSLQKAFPQSETLAP